MKIVVMVINPNKFYTLRRDHFLEIDSCIDGRCKISITPPIDVWEFLNGIHLTLEPLESMDNILCNWIMELEELGGRAKLGTDNIVSILKY